MIKLKDYGFDEEQMLPEGPSGYPKPHVYKELIREDPGLAVEDTYYFVTGFLKMMSVHNMEKIIDSYAASEHSSMWGSAQTKISPQQQNAANYMRGVSEMLKGLFQLVREIRDLDMRLKYYDETLEDYWEKDPQKAETSEITLKGLWVDLVEGGAKSPASIYGMSAQLGMVTLPDLFFRINPAPGQELEPRVKKVPVNPKVKEVLVRKLKQYYNWKQHSEMELRNRKDWTLKYLRQHYNTIKLYMQWIKPYLRNARALALSEKYDKNIDLVKTFETNLSEIEIMGSKKMPHKKLNAVIIVNFLFRTRPAMEYVRDFQHRGPQHTGKITMKFRGYVWTDEQIEQYKKMREDEDIDLIGDYDVSIMDAMETLGDDLKDYLEKAGESMPSKKEPEKKEEEKPVYDRIPMLEPFVALFKGFGDMLSIAVPEKKKSTGKKQPNSYDLWLSGQDEDEAKKAVRGLVFQTYRNYKKTNGMVTW